MEMGGKIPDRWLVLSVPAPPRGEEHLLVEALLRLGSRSVEPEGERYVAYLPPPQAVDALLRDAVAVIRASTGLEDPQLSWRWAPRNEGPGHARSAPPGRDSDPHPTTRACLGLLEGFVFRGERVADVGAGTGILSLAAARLGAREVLALEMDPLAAALARERVVEQGVGERVRVRALRAGADDLRRLGPFHGVVANLEAETLLALLPAFGARGGGGGGPDRCLHPGGWLILSGAHRGEGREIRDRASARGLAVVEEVVEEGWWTGGFRARRGVSSLP